MMPHQGVEDKRKVPQTYRLKLRINREQKGLFERAAALQGCSLPDFFIKSAYKAALKTIRDYELMVLTGANRDIFICTLLNPPKPTRKMRQAALRYRKALGQ